MQAGSGCPESGYYEPAGPARLRHEGQKEEAGPDGRIRAGRLGHDSAGTGAPAAALHRKGVTVSADTVRPRHAREGAESRATAPEDPHHRTAPTTSTPAPTSWAGTPAARAPGLKWVGDITYIRTWVGFVYLATVLDCCTKKVIGYAMADNMRTDLVCGRHRVWPCAAAPTRRTSRSSTRGRGSQYTSQQFARHLEHHRIRPSVGRTGVCWDNAWAESFNATLKNERVHRMVYPTREKAINFCCLVDRDRPCNHTRLHSTLGYRTPNEVEHELRSQKHAA